jgi:putative ABC transport system substrate-binding protein
MTRLLSLVTLILALLAAPLVAEAEPRAPRRPQIGVVYWNNISAETWLTRRSVKAFLEGMEELHWVKDRDFVLDMRPIEHFDRMQNVVASLVAKPVDVLLFLTCDAEFHIARRTTHRIPIVVGPCADDLVGKGVVASLAQPGGNITGISLLIPKLSAQRLSLLKEVVPSLSRVTVLWNPDQRDFALDWQELRAAADTMAVTLHSLEVRIPAVESALAHVITREGADGILGFPDRTHYQFPKQMASLAARTHLPGIYAHREVPEAGGLMSYGPNILQLFRRVATHVAKILSGSHPADLPIEQPTKFELVINLKTAKALGLTIPPSVLIRADEVIQ